MSEPATRDFLSRLYDDLEHNKLVLPSLPEIALQVRDTLEDPESSLSQVAKIVSRDAAMSARLIQVANSPLLRASREIETVEMAVMRMGGDMCRNVAVNIAMEQMFQATTPQVDKRLRTVWTHSSEVASIAYSLASFYTALNPDHAMLAGLIHDIGTLPILRLAEEHPDLLANPGALDGVVKEAHATVGAAILRQWLFQDDLIKVVIEHENYRYESSAPDYVDVVIVANLQSSGERGAAPRDLDWSTVPSFERLGLSPEVNDIDLDESNVDMLF